MIQENKCMCQFTERIYKAADMRIEISLKSKSRKEHERRLYSELTL